MTIKERAIEYCKEQWDEPTTMRAYMDGATEQKAIDDKEIKKLKSIMENSAIILGIGGVEWVNENARQLQLKNSGKKYVTIYQTNVYENNRRKGKGGRDIKSI